LRVEGKHIAKHFDVENHFTFAVYVLHKDSTDAPFSEWKHFLKPEWGGRYTFDNFEFPVMISRKRNVFHMVFANKSAAEAVIQVLVDNGFDYEMDLE
jgi:hypothetical protein